MTENELVKPLRLPAADTPLPEHFLPPLAKFSDMVQRPLFTPDRRDQPPVDTYQSPLVDEVDRPGSPTYPDVRFIGTVADGDGFRAFINSQHGVRTVAIGQDIDGWNVMIIDARYLVLERGTEQFKMNIFEVER